MSFLTCFWLLPQNEHLSRSPPSPMRATRRSFRSVLPTTSPARTPPAQLSALLLLRSIPRRRYLLARANAPIERRCRVIVTVVPPRADKVSPSANTPAPHGEHACATRERAAIRSRSRPCD